MKVSMYNVTGEDDSAYGAFIVALLGCFALERFAARSLSSANAFRWMDERMDLCVGGASSKGTGWVT